MGLIYTYYYDIYLTQVLIIVNMVIFIVILGAEMYYPGIMGLIYGDLAGRAIYLGEPGLLLTHGHTFLTMMFLHGGIMHVFGNIMVLFFIGMPLEDRVGKRLTFIFYIVAGLIATLGQYFFNWLQFALGGAPFEVLTIPNLGASGAVFGIMGTLVYLFPKDRITMIIPPLLLPNVRVDLAVGAFIMIQTGIALFAGTGNIAHAAHFTGLAGGIILAYYAKKAGIVQREKGPVRDYTKLKKLLDDEEKKKIYQNIIEADEIEVKEAWSEHLIEKSECPRCGRQLEDSRCKCGFNVWED
ncbi:MAG: rhomboid family intramembrane serine protease [Candidatus Thermoplasmatota archaeon]|nr:rhomboid family intramembrane serine protease [Candidatus Thermoplasmatota archaeon]